MYTYKKKRKKKKKKKRTPKIMETGMISTRVRLRALEKRIQIVHVTFTHIPDTSLSAFRLFFVSLSLSLSLSLLLLSLLILLLLKSSTSII
jgi:hypothetical protein